MRLLATLALLGPAACGGTGPAGLGQAPPTAAPPTAGQPLAALPGWPADRVAEAIRPMLAACGRPAPALRALCAGAGQLAPGDEAASRDVLARTFRAEFLGTGVFTGYFELEVRGSRARGGPFQVPVLRPPRDPRHYDRAAILDGALDGEGLELAWLASAADLYFLQLQGSGRIRLPDGSAMRLGWAAANGRAPVPTETLFAGADVPGDDLSIPGLRAWIAAHPQAGERRLARDPSYVFFRDTSREPADAGHVGALGVPLVPLRSIAVDPAIIALGTLVWIDTIDGATGQPLRRLVQAADTGEAIRGPARIDIFYGWDREAEQRGGRMHASGRAWRLVPVVSKAVRTGAARRPAGAAAAP